MDLAALKDAVRDWARAWARGWATHDAELIASLYADDAVFRSQPFRDPQEPLDYWNQADDTAQPPPEGWGPVLAHER